MERISLKKSDKSGRISQKNVAFIKIQGTNIVKKKSDTAKNIKGTSVQKSTAKSVILKLISPAKNSKIRIVDNTQKAKKPVAADSSVPKRTAVIVRPKRQPALLSPFRFPLLQGSRVARVARYTGVGFVMLGGIFALLNFQFLSNAVPSVAQVISSSTTTTTEALVDDTPDPTIFIESEQPLKGVIPISIVVPNARGIQVIGTSSSNPDLMLGNAVMIDATTWRLYWDTIQFPNATYKLKFVISNESTTYHYSNSDSYVVENISSSVISTQKVSTSTVPQTTTTSTSSISISTATTSTSINPTNPTVSIGLSDSTEFTDDVDMKVFAPDATEVKVFARNTATGILYFVAVGIAINDDEWKVRWDTIRVPNGSYTLHAKATIAGVVYESSVLTVSVQNTMIVNETAASTTVPIVEKPVVDMSIAEDSPLNGYVDILFDTSKVLMIEVYALPKYSSVPLFLGSAQKVLDTDWKFVWQTKQSPNGEYELYARIKSDYGYTESNRQHVKVFNEMLPVFTETQENEINDLQIANDSLVKVTDGTEKNSENSDILLQTQKPIYIQPVDSFIETIEYDTAVKNEIADIITAFRQKLSEYLHSLEIAIRTSDTESIMKIKEDIEKLKTDVLLTLPESIDKKEVIDKVNAYISEVTFNLLDLTIKNETLLKERVGDAVSKDSDKDSISDYDELNLYQTNPFSADTDGDGYTDGVEIEGGFNPRDSKNESVIKSDSPKENGTLREDLFSVDSISTYELDAEKTGELKALISGIGLPNSFVTLYVFSTPIIVTVKTDAEGRWSYIFDKELEDGEHEMYVGITNNEGTIVAKSNPFAFVKTAEAYVGADTETVGADMSTVEPSLFQSRMLLLIASISVAACGLVLILLGLHVHSKKDDEIPLLT